MLTKENKKLAEEVKLAYMGVDDGKLYKWAGKVAIRDRMKYPTESINYIKSVQSTIMAVICTMIVKGAMKLS